MFSTLQPNTDIAITRDIYKNFTRRINDGVEDCCKKYGLDVQSTIVEDTTLSMVCLARKFEGEKFMVLFDEYDRFANELMFQNLEAYEKTYIDAESFSSAMIS